MSICDKLKDNYEFDCLHPESGGGDEELMLINMADINRATDDYGFGFNVTNPLLIETIALKTGAKAYTVTGKRNPNTIMSEPVFGDASSGYTHGVQFHLYEVDKATVGMLNALKDRPVMAIHKTNQRNADGDNVFKVLGRVNGVYLETSPYNSNENAGVVVVNLRTLEGHQEPNAAEFLFDTDYATTEAYYDGLKEVVTE